MARLAMFHQTGFCDIDWVSITSSKIPCDGTYVTRVYKF